MMKFSIVPGLLLRLRAAPAGGECGWFTGVSLHDEVIILGIFPEGSEQDGLPGYPECLLPHGISIVGAFVTVHGSSGDNGEAQLLSMAKAAVLRVGNNEASDTFLGAILRGAENDVSFSWIASSSSTPVQPQEIQSSEQGRPCAWLEQHYTFVRCHASVTATVYGIRQLAEGSRSAMQSLAAASQPAFDALADSLTGISSVFVASAAGAGQRILGEEEASSCGDLGGTLAQPLQVDCYSRRTAAGSSAPVLEYHPAQGGPVSVDTALVHLDVLCLAPTTLPAAQLPEMALRPALRAQLAAMRQTAVSRGALCTLRALHFLPPGWQHPLTLPYPLGLGASGKSLEAAEEQLLPLRQALHRRLGLPQDRPLLRCANALTFAEGGQQPEDGGAGRVKGRLRDVHVGLPASGVPGGRQHLVQGSYEYYHYMQDRFDDAGWGCAYRSLQTLCSWFRAQHYTAAPVPTHAQIQQTLIDIGDKPRSFVGSKQWVGAIELGFVLDTYLGITCRVITVPSGADMPSRAREIAHHFDTQGTPIMIGGGVLAYTLLGIDYSESSGACAFLILDPHYTGGDDLKLIQKGQWVAWKSTDGRAAAGGDLFVRDAFYNLLCPQRPCTV